MSDWENISLGEILSFSSGESLPKENWELGRIPVYGGNGVSGYHSQSNLNISRLILGRVGEHCGNAYITEKESWVTDNALIVSFNNKEQCLSFWRYILNYLELRKQAYSSAQPVITGGILSRIKMDLPPFLQQQKIARILNTVDNLIEKTQVLIDKYTSVKQGMMADLFTRGIDVSGSSKTNKNFGQLRPSATESPELYQETSHGLIPKVWSVVTLGDISEKITSGSRDWASYYSDEGELFVRISNLTREHINFRWNSIKYVDIGSGSEGERTRLEGGDILISITADLGIIGVVPDGLEKAYINQHTALVRINKNVNNPRYIGHFLQSYTGQHQFEQLGDSGAKAGLNLPTIASLQCFLPSDTEQNEITNRLDTIDQMIADYKIEKEKYLNQKKGLMQDLLTGKVSVL